jgi:hypothetical protein
LCWSSGAWSKASRRATGRAGSKSGSIPMSIPTDSHYIGRDAKGYRKAPPFGYLENQKYRIRIVTGMNQVYSILQKKFTSMYDGSIHCEQKFRLVPLVTYLEFLRCIFCRHR